MKNGYSVSFLSFFSIVELLHNHQRRPENHFGDKGKSPSAKQAFVWVRCYELQFYANVTVSAVMIVRFYGVFTIKGTTDTSSGFQS